MKMFKSIRYFFNCYEKVKKINIEYELKSESDTTASVISEEIIPVAKYISGDYHKQYEYRKQVSFDNKKVFNKRAKELLEDARKEGFMTNKQGVYVQGSHIVSCSWTVWLETENITFEEYCENILGDKNSKEKNKSI